MRTVYARAPWCLRPWAGGMDPGGFGGPGGPGTIDPSDPRRQWVAEMHRSLHAEQAAADRPADG